jgi:hypothetical protein
MNVYGINKGSVQIENNRIKDFWDGMGKQNDMNFLNL